MDDVTITASEQVGDFGEEKVIEFYRNSGWRLVPCHSLLDLLKALRAIPQNDRDCERCFDHVFEKTDDLGKTLAWDFVQVKTCCRVHENGLREFGDMTYRQRNAYLTAAEVINKATHPDSPYSHLFPAEVGVWLWVVDRAGIAQADMQLAMENLRLIKPGTTTGFFLHPRDFPNGFVIQDRLTVSEKNDLKHRCHLLRNERASIADAIARSQLNLGF